MILIGSMTYCVLRIGHLTHSANSYSKEKRSNSSQPQYSTTMFGQAFLVIFFSISTQMSHIQRLTVKISVWVYSKSNDHSKNNTIQSHRPFSSKSIDFCIACTEQSKCIVFVIRLFWKENRTNTQTYFTYAAHKNWPNKIKWLQRKFLTKKTANASKY